MARPASVAALCLHLLLFKAREVCASTGQRQAASDARGRGPRSRSPQSVDEQQQLQPSVDFYLAPPPGATQSSGLRLADPGGREARQLRRSEFALHAAIDAAADESSQWHRDVPSEEKGGQSPGVAERGGAGGSFVSGSFRRIFRAIEYERAASRGADAPCLRVDQRSAVTALLLTIIFPSAAHFYYGYVVLGVLQLCLSVVVYLPLCLACGWWWRPVQPVLSRPYAFGGEEDALNDTVQKVRSRTAALVVMVVVALVVALVLTLWQLAMIVRLATGDMLPANGCPSSPL